MRHSTRMQPDRTEHARSSWRLGDLAPYLRLFVLTPRTLILCMPEGARSPNPDSLAPGAQPLPRAALVTNDGALSDSEPCGR